MDNMMTKEERVSQLRTKINSRLYKDNEPKLKRANKIFYITYLLMQLGMLGNIVFLIFEYGGTPLIYTGTVWSIAGMVVCTVFYLRDQANPNMSNICILQFVVTYFIAVIINGNLLETGEYPGCEFGHMVIKENGLECNCGRKGCFEKYGSMRAFKDNLRNELGLEDKTSGKELMAILKNTTKESKDYAKIEKVRKQYIKDLSVGITNLVNIFEPEAIGIGGSFVYFSEALLDDIKELIIKENMLFNSRKEINIQTAVLGNEAGIIGAIL